MTKSKMIISMDTLEDFLFGTDVMFTYAKSRYFEPDPNTAVYPGAKIPRVKIDSFDKKIVNGEVCIELTLEGDEAILENHPQVTVRISREEEAYKDGYKSPTYLKTRYTLRDASNGKIIAGYKSKHDIELEKLTTHD